MFKVRTKLQREYSYFCRYLNFITTQCRITWTLLASDMKAIESFCINVSEESSESGGTISNRILESPGARVYYLCQTGI